MREELGSYGYEYCSLDSGWSLATSGDEFGRITYDPSLFDLPELADHLHDKGAKLGVYILPGFFSADADKKIEGTDISLSSIQTDEQNPCRAMSRCNINYNKTGAQEWCDSNVKQFAEWGVDLIKLDYVTPGSPDADADLSTDNSGSVACYHKAIENSGRKMRLHISWNLDRNTTYYDIWKSNADAMRTDRDINNSNKSTLTQWSNVQHAIEQYRQYILLQLDSAAELTIYPDLDALLIGNAANTTGLTDLQRQAVFTHWIGAGAPLLLGSDLTALDAYGKALLSNPLANDVARFTAGRPMVPTQGNSDGAKGRQRQVWLAGPDETTGVVVAVLANYGANGNNDLFGSKPDDSDQVFTISPKDLGLASSGYYVVEDVWANTTVDLGYGDAWTWTLDKGGAAALLRLTPSMTGGGENGTDSTTDGASATAAGQQQQGKRALMELPQKAFVQYHDGLTSGVAPEATDAASNAAGMAGPTWSKLLTVWLGVAGLQTAVLWLL
ncbi:Glycoside hydrolase family 27 [Lasiodiplodia theobromae]|uniref:Alpha-galactosidase n=1 Tax=Lasiodiplodia theobromae TaxID=45133 RepID=A0A5N5D7F8_9PEZI|nr:Alpha-galactosidase 3 [Lasiodiplodia theobromae]KAF9631816.1 Glycoside hydrolase family 27 [Lasiodiplodia theobromae]